MPAVNPLDNLSTKPKEKICKGWLINWTSSGIFLCYLVKTISSRKTVTYQITKFLLSNLQLSLFLQQIQHSHRQKHLSFQTLIKSHLILTNPFKFRNKRLFPMIGSNLKSVVCLWSKFLRTKQNRIDQNPVLKISMRSIMNADLIVWQRNYWIEEKLVLLLDKLQETKVSNLLRKILKELKSKELSRNIR